MNVKHPYLVMLGIYLCAFAGMFGETSLNIALTDLMKDFHVSTGILQWMVVGYLLVIGIVLPLTSLLVKCFPVKKLVLFALGAFIVGSLLAICATQFGVLVAGRMIQGIGTGLILPILFSVPLEIFPPQKVGSAIGIGALVVMFATAIGPTLSGFILGALSWRWIFIFMTIISVVALVFTLLYMVNPYKLTKPKVDILSCLLSAVGFGGIVIGFSLASDHGWTSVSVILPLVIGVLAIFLYAKRQLSLKTPVLNLRVFANSHFLPGALVVMLSFGALLAIMYLLPQYLQRSMLIPVMTAGLIMLPGGIVNAFISFISGRLYDHMGAKGLVKAGFLIAIVGVVMLLFASAKSSVAYILLCTIVLMVGIPMITSPAQTNALSALPKNQSTDGSTIINTMQQVFGAVCTAITTCLLSAGENFYVSRGKGKADAFASGSHNGFYFALALVVIGFFISFLIKDSSLNNEPAASENDLTE